MSVIRGVEEIKSRPLTRSRAIPLSMNQPYINIFMFRKERERLEREGSRLKVKIESIVARLGDIEREVGKLQKDDKRAQKIKRFEWVGTAGNLKKETNPEERAKSCANTGWKIRKLK